MITTATRGSGDRGAGRSPDAPHPGGSCGVALPFIRCVLLSLLLSLAALQVIQVVTAGGRGSPDVVQKGRGQGREEMKVSSSRQPATALLIGAVCVWPIIGPCAMM